VLRVEHGGVARAHPEERRIEHVDVGEPAARLHVRRIAQLFRRNSRGEQLIVGEEGNGFDAFADICPQSRGTFRAGKPSRQSDNRNGARSKHFAGVVHGIRYEQRPSYGQAVRDDCSSRIANRANDVPP
jgi:hypothetical protein